MRSPTFASRGRVDATPMCQAPRRSTAPCRLTGDGGVILPGPHNLFVRRELFDAVGGLQDWALERRDRKAGAGRCREREGRSDPIGMTVFEWQSGRRIRASAVRPRCAACTKRSSGRGQRARSRSWHGNSTCPAWRGGARGSGATGRSPPRVLRRLDARSSILQWREWPQLVITRRKRLSADRGPFIRRLTGPVERQ